MPEVLVIIPTFNEKDNLSLIIDRLFSSNPQVHALIVDDNSPDGTGQLADNLAREDQRIHVMHRQEKNGLGGAYIAGFYWGLARGYDLLVEMDADGSHAPEQLPSLIAKIQQGADLVLGSRYVPGGAVVNWPKYREWLSRGGNTYVRLLLGVPLHDITGGFRVYTREILEKIDLDTIESHGYCFQIDLAWRAYESGAVISEVPIEFVERVHGESKMSGNIISEALLRVTVWGLAYRWQTVKKRFWLTKRFV